MWKPARRFVAAAAVVVAAAGAAWLLAGGRGEPVPRLARPVVFVHGMSASAATMGTRGGQFHPLLPRISASFPRPGVCQLDAEPRPWNGSPCVFRYVDDIAATSEPGARCPCDSQSGILENARKLAADVSEVSANAGGDRVILVGYSMGGAIVRAYLGLFHERADREVAAAVLVDPATTGSWAFVLDARRHIDDPLFRLLAGAASRFVASRSGVALDSPAFADLQPRSPAYRAVAALPLPRTVSTYTFWGDIRLEIAPAAFGIERTVEIGDVALLPGDPDPTALPALGGQRFRPTGLIPPAEALEIRHTRHLRLTPGDVADLSAACLERTAGCVDTAIELLDIPDSHSNVPTALARIVVEPSALGGRRTLEDAILVAIARNV
ncbi:MAG TPA: alpha/beta fold hydrolase [Actinomycetota bacterium]|nr:alpha/beta fold hydrolase [Actinomycetota bacterium]